MSLFKKDERETVKETNEEDVMKEKDLEIHPTAAMFVEEALNPVTRELRIFEERYRDVMSLGSRAAKADVKRRISRVKRAAMDLRDALKDLGKFTH